MTSNDARDRLNDIVRKRDRLSRGEAREIVEVLGWPKARSRGCRDLRVAGPRAWLKALSIEPRHVLYRLFVDLANVDRKLTASSSCVLVPRSVSRADEDRARRFRLALLAQPTTTDAEAERSSRHRRLSPTAEQWRIVGDALGIFLGRGKWSMFAPVAQQLPEFTVDWNSLAMPAEAAALTQYSIEGDEIRIGVHFRTSRSRDALLRDALHEFQHVHDAALIVSGQLSKVQYEARAAATEARLARLWW
jgi:hypothetical protein